MRGRAVVAVWAGLAALAWPGAAAASYVPRVLVEHSTAPSIGMTTVSIQVPRADDATARATVYVPRAYFGVLAQQDGTEIGTAEATVVASRVSPETVVTLRGAVRAEDPARHVGDPCMPDVRSTVWLLVLEGAGRTLEIPLYVDVLDTGPEAAFARFRLQLCMPPPNLPGGEGGGTFGAKLVSLSWRFRSQMAVGAGEHVWPAVLVPYAADGRADAAATVEARALVRRPGRITLAGRITSRAQQTIVLSGALTENGVGIPGLQVEMLIGGRHAFGTRTGARGRYSLALRRRGRGRVTSVFRARVAVPARDVTRTACGGTSLAPRGCVSATASAFTVLSRAVRITL